MSYQQITLVGNVGNTPELRYTASGVEVTGFSLAVNKHWTDASGQKQEKTLWFKVSAWRKLAIMVAEHVVKGKQLLVVGELEEARMYQDRDGNTQVSLDVTANTIRFLGTRGDEEGEGETQGASASNNKGSKTRHNAPVDDEDIPF